ncbi:glycosyl hydrolase-related protein [Georgenia sp. TF02-10]|uniref:alpha-mannosidase n=1 Tax=Georgenia sp. TF02-10 TaxID=2917725 RepID=UPI001FA72B3C|nr:glycoside hydrolase family 38 C-terminal domain-containing protein [Georgenia sp. TF02-10]UNX56277.1 glycosyl hydrolase-related protein [Georgenia sp. TF02-10]
MHRLSSLEGRIERTLLERLVPAVYSGAVPVEVAAVHLPGEPVPAAEAIAMAYTPFAVGERWGPPWSTTWFRLTGRVPEAMRGRRVELLVDLGFEGSGPGFRSEGLAYTADAVPIKGVEPRTPYVPVTRRARGGEAVEVYVEAAANPRFTGAVSAEGDPRTASAAPLYRLDQAELAVLEEEVYGLVLDVHVLSGLAATLAETDPRRHQIHRALEDMLDELDLGDVVGAAPAARARLAGVLAAPAVPSAHRVTAVGHAHIDSAWLWPVRETIRKCARTFANVTALAEDYPDLVFAASSAQQYAWMREHHPQVYRRMREQVEAGRFLPVGGMWVESDTNMPGGEALVRQFTQGKRYFRDELGVEPEEVWLPDSFGYSGALPQLARLAGFRWFLSQKMSWNETNPFPHHTFWWEGIDGTRVFTHFPPADTYSAELSAEELARGVRTFAEHGRASRSLLPFGHGDGGGGPTREMLEIAHRVRDLEGSPRVTLGSPAEFFAAAQAEYPRAPVWSGEMYLEAHRGTYTSQREMKRGNRRSEHLLREAELWSAAAAVAGLHPYPYEELDRLWQETLLLQFHDVLPGSSIAWVHRQARQTYARLAADLDRLVDAAQAALAGAGDVELAFNAAPHVRDGVPALAAAPAAPPGGEDPVRVTTDGAGTVLDNGLLRVRVGPDGTLTSVRDLVADREVLAPGAAGNVLQLHPDTPNRFDAWDLDASYRHRRRDLTAVNAMTVDGTDPARPVVQVDRSDGGSRYRQTVALAAGRRRVDLTADIDWRERETLVKVAFPLAVHADRAAAETQFGHVLRPTHTNTSWDAARFEICAHRWVHVAEPGYGVAVVNDSVYGHDITAPGPGEARGAGPTTVRLSLLRAPRYPDPETDQGRHRFGYALVCGAEVADAVREGYRANLPLRRRRGAGPVEPLVRVSPTAVVEAVKLADDRSGDVVVRLYEPLGARGRAEVATSFDLASAWVCDLLERRDEEVAALAPLTTASARAVTLDLGPFQVVTLRLRPVPARAGQSPAGRAGAEPLAQSRTGEPAAGLAAQEPDASPPASGEPRVGPADGEPTTAPDRPPSAGRP